MTEADAAWMDVTARLAECAALLLDKEGHVVAADSEALALLGCHDVADAKRRWDRAGGQAALISADAGALAARGERGEIALEGEGSPVRLAVRILRLGGGEPRFLALLSKPKVRADDQGFAFARKVSHDLRGPLNSMVLNLDLLRTTLERDRAEEEVEVRRQRYIAAIQREIDRMNVELTRALTEARGEMR